MRQYGGLFRTPPYLVEVMPVLKLGGVVLANGTGGAGLGVKLDFRIELGLPGGADEVENRVIAGNLTAIGLAAGQVTVEEGRQDEAARVLARLAFHYLDRWNRSDEELAALLRVVPVRPSVSTCLVQSAVEVEYAGGDPLYPVRYDWKGLAIDADRRPSAPVGIETDAAERDFLLASSLEGSVLEHRLFEDDLGHRQRLDGEGAPARGPAGHRGARPRPRERGVGPARPAPRRGREGRDPGGGGEGLPDPRARGPADRPGLDGDGLPDPRPGHRRVGLAAAGRPLGRRHRAGRDRHPRRASWTSSGASRSRPSATRAASRSSRSSTRPTSSWARWTSRCRSPSRSSPPTRPASRCPAPP